MPLVDYLHKAYDDKDPLVGDKVARLMRFTLRYHKGGGSLDPSDAFSIICEQKYYFGNFSQQDSYDALLTNLDALVTEQKKTYAKTKGITATPLCKIPDESVPLGQIFSFYLSSKLRCKACSNVTWVDDPALSIHAALSVGGDTHNVAVEKPQAGTGEAERRALPGRTAGKRKVSGAKQGGDICGH